MLKRALVALIVVTSFGVLAPHGVHAAPATGFNIFQQANYCRNNTTTCWPPLPPFGQNVKQRTFIFVQAVNFHGKSSGTPDLVKLICANYYVDYFTGDLHAIYEQVYASPDSGLIRGTASVDPGASETSMHATSSLNLVVYDGVSGDRARVWGTSITNNTDGTPPNDFLEAGGFVVYLSGPRYDVNFSASGFPVTNIGVGDMGCHTTNITPLAGSSPSVTAPIFESLMGDDPDGDLD